MFSVSMYRKSSIKGCLLKNVNSSIKGCFRRENDLCAHWSFLIGWLFQGIISVCCPKVCPAQPVDADLLEVHLLNCHLHCLFTVEKLEHGVHRV